MRLHCLVRLGHSGIRKGLCTVCFQDSPLYLLYDADWCYRVIPADGLLAYPPPLPTFETQDVELLRHYATQSSLTLSPRDTLSLFQVNVPGEAKSHLYLMHSVLAFSALHLSFVDIQNRGRLSQLASKQHEQALAAFRESVHEVNQDNGSAITAFSYLTIVYTLGLPIVYGFASVPSPSTSFCEVLQVLRRAWSAIDPTQKGVESGTLRELIKPVPHQRKACVMHTKAAKVVRFLNYFLDTSPACEKENEPTYREALAHWEYFVMNQPCKPPLWAHALVWPMTVSHSFFQLMLERKPFAMVMLAIWIIALYRAPNMWFNAWAKEVVTDIWNMADEETKKALMWPVEVIGIIPKKDHPSDCVCWDCREGTQYVKVRDAAAAVLVDRTKEAGDEVTNPPPPAWSTPLAVSWL
jgi:hypothetical protein